MMLDLHVRNETWYVSHYPFGFPCRVPKCAHKSRNGRCDLTGHEIKNDICQQYVKRSAQKEPS